MTTKNLNSDLSMFVDIMYYDFLLYKIVEIYRSETLKNNNEEYYDILKILCSKFEKNKIVLDYQICLKILYIKFKRILFFGGCFGNDNKVQPKSFCCSFHVIFLLKKFYIFLLRLKEEHASLGELKIYKDIITLIASLIFINTKGKLDSTEEMSSVIAFLKEYDPEITTPEGYNRFKVGMFIKLGVRKEDEFDEKMFISINTMLERVFSMLNEPFLYSLTVEKVTTMFRKHSKVFKDEKEYIKVTPKEIFKPGTPGETVNWEEK